MHILVNGWFWDQPNTGSGQYLRHLLQNMAEIAPTCQLTLLTPQAAGSRQQAAGGGWQPAGEQAAPQFPISSIRYPLPSLPRRLAKLYWEQVTAPRIARNLGVDLLFVPYWAAPIWQPVPTVVTVHDVVQRVLPAYRGGRLMQMYTGLVSYSARRSAAVLTVSQASKREIVDKLGMPAERIFVVYHGPNHDTQGTSAGRTWAQVQQKYHLPARYFLYLGGFDVRKNVASIVKAYARYRQLGGDPHVELVLAGKLPAQESSFFPDPRRLAAEHGVAAWSHFPGWVDEADKPALYAAATAFLFPSVYEGFGMMLLEAMAAGTPVITSAE